MLQAKTLNTTCSIAPGQNPEHHLLQAKTLNTTCSIAP